MRCHTSIRHKPCEVGESRCTIHHLRLTCLAQDDLQQVSAGRIVWRYSTTIHWQYKEEVKTQYVLRSNHPSTTQPVPYDHSSLPTLAAWSHYCLSPTLSALVSLPSPFIPYPWYPTPHQCNMKYALTLPRKSAQTRPHWSRSVITEAPEASWCMTSRHPPCYLLAQPRYWGTDQMREYASLASKVQLHQRRKCFISSVEINKVYNCSCVVDHWSIFATNGMQQKTRERWPVHFFMPSLCAFSFKNTSSGTPWPSPWPWGSHLYLFFPQQCVFLRS